MQHVYGLAWFEDTDPKKTRETLGHISIDGIKFHFFNGIDTGRKKIPLPGVVMKGKVGDNWTSKKIIERVRYHLGLSQETKNCDLSIENEDRVIPVRDGLLEGLHATIRIEQPWDLESILSLLNNIRKEIEVGTLFFRTGEEREKGLVACIDISIQKKQEQAIQEIVERLKKEGLNVTEVWTVNLE